MSLAGSFNGLSFGPSQKVHVSGHSGLADLPEVRTTDVLRGGEDGAFPGQDLMGSRVITLDLAVIGDDHADFLTQFGNVEKATVPQQLTELPLYVLGSTRVIFCRPRRRAMPTETDHYQRTGTVSVEFVASDPRVYDATQQNASSSATVASGGVKFSVHFPLAFTGGGGSPGIISAANSGSLYTYPLATLQGPCTNPTLWNDTLGVYVQFLLTLASTDQLVIDFLRKTVVINGTASRRSSLAPGSTWWGLPPNTTCQIRYTAASATGSALSLSWRPAWSGATA